MRYVTRILGRMEVDGYHGEQPCAPSEHLRLCAAYDRERVYLRLRQQEELDRLLAESRRPGRGLGQYMRLAEEAASGSVTIVLESTHEPARIATRKREVVLRTITISRGDTVGVGFQDGFYLLNPDTVGLLFEEVDSNEGALAEARRLVADAEARAAATETEPEPEQDTTTTTGRPRPSKRRADRGSAQE